MRIHVVIGLTTSLFACGKVVDTPQDGASDSPVDVAVDDPPPLVPRLFVVTGAQLDFSQVSKSGLEVIDAETMTFDRNVDLGFGGVSSAAVSPDGKTVYIADFASGEVRFHDTTTGISSKTVTLAQVRDLAINADGTKLYAASGQNVVEIDTTTGDTRPSPAVGGPNTLALNLGLSPDGARVGVSTTNGGSNPTITLVRTMDMSIENAIPITTNVTGCGASPGAVAFKNNGLLVTWDTNCDALYQVDVGTHTQLTAGSIATGRDSGSSFISSNKLTVSAASGLVYAIKEDANLAIMNTQTTTFTQIAGVDTPFASGMLDDGTKLFVAVIHRFNGGGADTFNVIDTNTANVTPDAYTFSGASQSAIDVLFARTP